MPESTRDRPTRAHEQLFLFAKSERYFYDADAIREPFADHRQGRDGSRRARERDRGGRSDGLTKPNGIDPSANGGRNRRTVWTLGPERSHVEHFATFPTKLVEPCVLAGTSERGACSACGAPWRRMKTKATGGAIGKSWLPHSKDGDAERGNGGIARGPSGGGGGVTTDNHTSVSLAGRTRWERASARAALVGRKPRPDPVAEGSAFEACLRELLKLPREARPRVVRQLARRIKGKKR